MEEGLVHDSIIQVQEVRDNLRNILAIDSNNIRLVHEDPYINGITADFTLIADNKIRAIIECKGDDIGVTEFVRGIGQVLQYEYFHDKNIIPRNIQYGDNFHSILLFPSDLIKNNSFNIGRFKYPESTILVELNNFNKILRKVDETELDKLEKAFETNLVTVCQYYVRDNRIYELFILLKYLTYLKNKGVHSVDRKESEGTFLTRIKTQNNGNWRNAFISLSSLGFIDSKNIPTSSGVKYADYSFEKFAIEIYKSYIKPYFEVILPMFGEGQTLKISNAELCDKIKSQYLGRDVLFLSESKGRYISSWMNILRDDYGCLSFDSRNSERRMNYNLLNYNDTALENAIKQNTVAYTYIDRYFELLNE